MILQDSCSSTFFLLFPSPLLVVTELCLDSDRGLNQKNSVLHKGLRLFQKEHLFSLSSTLQSRTGKYRVLPGNPCNENRIPVMRTGFPVMKTGFSLWELTNSEFPVSLTGFGFAVYVFTLFLLYSAPKKQLGIVKNLQRIF